MPRRLVAAVLCLLALVLAVPVHAQTDDFTVVALPDTQHYSRAYPHIFESQTEWIAKNRAALNIQFVVGLGDVVDYGSSQTQYENADAAIRILDAAGVPYVLPVGNHDYDDNKPSARKATLFNAYFGPSRYAGKAHYQGQYPAGSNENFYSVFEVAGRKLLVLALEFNPRDGALQWASNVVAAHRDKEVIVTTHSYMFSDDSRVAKCDPDSSATYGLTADNDGEEMWHNFVKQHSNIVMVLSGHIKVGDGTGRLSEIGVNGNLINQVLADYQAYPEGGSGYLRILRFRPSLNRIEVSTYSPYLNAYMTDPENQFTLRYKNDLLGQTGTGYAVGRIRAGDCTKLSSVTVAGGGASTITNAEGLYRLGVTGPYAGEVRASKSGYSSSAAVLTLHSAYDTAHDFWMSASSTSSAALHGRVLYALDNSGVGAATVTLGGRSVLTDGTGYYSFSDVVAGTHTVTVNKSGWLPASATTSVQSGILASLDIPFSTAGVLRGVIVDSAGNPKAGVAVTASGGVLSTSHSAFSDANGSYSLGWIPVGDYTVNATADGVTRTATANITAGSTTTVDFTLSSTSTEPAVNIHTPLTGSTVGSPVRVYATATSSSEVWLMQIYVQGKKVIEVRGNSVDQSVPVQSGSNRRLTVQAYDRDGRILKSTVYISVP